MRPLRLLPLLLLTCLATGCATVIHGVHQDVRVETDPPGATASADGQTITTPGVLKINRQSKTFEIFVEKEGYVSLRVPLTRRYAGPYQANWFFGLIGGAVTKSYAGVLALPVAAVGVDIATGAAYRIEPSKIFLRLEPVSAAEKAGE